MKVGLVDYAGALGLREDEIEEEEETDVCVERNPGEKREVISKQRPTEKEGAGQGGPCPVW
jgi:hypothetical protein